MIFRINGLSDTNEFTLSCDGKIMPFEQDGENAIEAEVSEGREYLISSEKHKIKFRDKILFWLLCGILEFSGPAEKTSLLDTLSFTVENCNMYDSILLVKGSEGVVETEINGAKCMLGVVLVSLCGNRANAEIHYKRKYEPQEIKSRYRIWQLENLLAVITIEVVLGLLCFLCFLLGFTPEITEIIMIALVVWGLRLIAYYVTLLLKEHKVYSYILEHNTFEASESYYDNSPRKSILFRNKIEDYVIVQIQEENGSINEILLNGKNAKKKVTISDSEKISIKSREGSFETPVTKNKFLKYLDILFYKVIWNIHFTELLGFDVYFHEKSVLTQEIVLSGGNESETITYDYDGKRKCWNCKGNTKNISYKFEGESVDVLFGKWLAEVFITMSLYFVIMFLVFAIGYLLVEKLAVIVVGCLAGIKVLGLSKMIVDGLEVKSVLQVLQK